MNIPFAQQVLLFDNKRLDDNKATLKTVNVRDGDMIQVQNNQYISTAYFIPLTVIESLTSWVLFKTLEEIKAIKTLWEASTLKR